MKKISLWYTDFYEGFDPSNNVLQNLLKSHYELILDPENPDFLIYSCYGLDFLKYKDSVRIYYTGENLIPDFNLCDYAIGFSFLDFEDRYLRYPNFALIEDQFEKLQKSSSASVEDLKKKKYFCNFIYSNSHADPARDHFFHLLGNYKKVVSPGKHLNNSSMDIGGRFTEDWMYTKLKFQSRCKFSIAFENSSSPGYTTEKLMHAYITNTIPIYWGNPEVTKDFNRKSLINCHEFKTLEEVIERVKEIDQNQEMALQMLNETPFADNQVPTHLKQGTLESFLKNIFDQVPTKAFRRPRYGTTPNYEKKFLQSHKKEIKSQNSFLKQFLNFRIRKD